MKIEIHKHLLHKSLLLTLPKLKSPDLVVVGWGHEELGVRRALQQEAPNGVGGTVVEVKQRERSAHLHMPVQVDQNESCVRGQGFREKRECARHLNTVGVMVTAKRRLRSASRDSSPRACTNKYMSS